MRFSFANLTAALPLVLANPIGKRAKSLQAVDGATDEPGLQLALYFEDLKFVLYTGC